MELDYKKNQSSFYGQIPNDWLVCSFEDVLDGFSSGMTPYRGKPEFYKGNIPWITSGELNYNTISDTHEKITKEAVIKTNLKILPIGTFLMAITGLEAAGTRGSCGITGIKATTNQSCMALFPKDGKILSKYLYYFYVKYGNVLALKYCQGTKQQSYTGRIVKILPINLPPNIEEQKSIAAALSDIDELITGLEKLISKKKDIKRGAMQQLLTPPQKGGKRLPGFSGDWVEKRLGDLTSMSSGGTPSSKNSKYYDGQIIWVSITDISNSGKYISDSSKKITNIGLQNSSAKIFTKNTLLLAMYASIGKCCITTKEVSTSQAILGINTAKELSTEFLYYFFLFKQKELASQGQQGAQSNLNKAMVQDILISTPEIVEQQEIAKALRDMDGEITQLETKKEKYENIKQGMMQELLTGKTRLV